MEQMIYLLIGIVIIQFIYLLYQDFSNRREREKLQILLKSGNLNEYQSVIKPLKKSKEIKKENKLNPFLDIEEVPIETLMKAEDRL